MPPAIVTAGIEAVLRLRSETQARTATETRNAAVVFLLSIASASVCTGFEAASLWLAGLFGQTAARIRLIRKSMAKAKINTTHPEKS